MTGGPGDDPSSEDRARAAPSDDAPAPPEPPRRKVKGPKPAPKEPRHLTGKALGAWLIAEARGLGFDDAQTLSADTPLPDVVHLRAAVAEGRLEPLDYMARTLDQRADVRVRVEGAKSVLVLVMNYFTGHHEEHVDPALHDSGARVSRYAWGQDYHHLMRRRLRKLRGRLLEKAGDPTAKVAPFGDQDPVYERAWARASGMGFVGKSALFIHREHGTWTFLAGLITTLDLGAEPREPMTSLCGTCTACMDACPTQAIVDAGKVDARKCLVTWNVENPTDPRGDDPALKGHGWAIGCDICQEVCPWNKFEHRTLEERLQPRPGQVMFTAEEPPTEVAGTALARPGLDVLPRLAARALEARESAAGAAGDTVAESPNDDVARARERRAQRLARARAAPTSEEGGS